MKTWVKLYTEITRDPKWLTLDWEQRGIWCAVLAMTGEIDDRDADGVETGALDTVEYTALRIRCDLGLFAQAVAAFTERGMIEERDGILYLPNYARYLPDKGRPPFPVARWRSEVFERDDYRCRDCGSRGVQLQAHHVVPWHSAPDLRFDVDNGITLCRDCHHKRHGRGWKQQARRAAQWLG